MYSCKILIGYNLLDVGKKYEETCSPSYAMTGKKRLGKLEVQYQKIGLIFVLFIYLFIYSFVSSFIFSSVWLEVDISHPEQINQWIRSRDLGLKYSATFNDFTQR